MKEECQNENKVELWINYWSGDFFVGIFESKAAAEKHFEENKGHYRDYRGEEHGYSYGTPLYMCVNEIF